MNNWQKIWNARKDTLANVDGKNWREVFAELMSIDGYDSNSDVTMDSLIRQHEILKTALNVSGGGVIYLKSVAARE